jgi:8-hydroxy-5-deazaflavin:NADPH oxidoreductase
MRIAIVGAGSVGATLGRAWLERGEDIVWGLRNPADPKHAALPRERVKTPAEAAGAAEIVVIATPRPATEAAVASLGNLAGKIVVDCTNPVAIGPDGPQSTMGSDNSAGEQVAKWAPGAQVCKAFNTTGVANMARAADYSQKPMMPVAGDDAAAKSRVMELVAKLAFEPVDAGPLRNARLLESMAVFWIDQAMKRGRGPNFAFALTKLG